MDTTNPTATDYQNDPPNYDGHHGKMDSQYLHGWAWDKNHPERSVQIEIYSDEQLIAMVTADKHRPDLLVQQIGTGNYGFRFPIPPGLRDGQTHSIRLRIAGTMRDLQQTPKPLTCTCFLEG
jgi:hypothetical protein